MREHRSEALPDITAYRGMWRVEERRRRTSAPRSVGQHERFVVLQRERVLRPIEEHWGSQFPLLAVTLARFACQSGSGNN